MGGVAWSIPEIPAEREYCEQARRALTRIREEMRRLEVNENDERNENNDMSNNLNHDMNHSMNHDVNQMTQGDRREVSAGQQPLSQSSLQAFTPQPPISQPISHSQTISQPISQPISHSQPISQPISQSQTTSQSQPISHTLQTPQSSQQPRRDFYDATKDLFLSLLRAGDLRDITQLQTYLGVQFKIRQLMRQHAPPETLRPLQMSIPNPLEIRDKYSNREHVSNVFEEVKARLQACDPTMAERTLAMIPEDPVMFVEMNSLQRLLDLVDVLQFNTGIVELASVKENELFVQHWTKMMLECRKIITECKQWMDSVEEDIKGDVLNASKTREWMHGWFDDVD